jgi:multisubunit Na+/H+ antiporter MnhG subunit
MTPAHALSAALLATGVAIALFACVGSVCVRGPLARLHYVSLAATLGAALVVAAVVVERGASKSSGKALLLLVVLLAEGGALGHATARAHELRERRLERDRVIGADEGGGPS